MAKTNFTKVEEALEQGLRKMNVEHLFEVAEEAQQKDKKQEPEPVKTDKPKETHLTKAQNHLINSLKRDLIRFQIKEHRAMYTDLGLKKAQLKKKIETPLNLSPEDWEQIKKIKEKIDLYKEELLAKLPVESNENLVESQRTKHINKRFNVNDNWLPLH